MDFPEELAARILCGDGAIGTMLLDAGISSDQCFEERCVSHPDEIRALHERYIAAGADVIETNSFGANAVRLARFGMEGRVVEFNRAAAEIACAVVRRRGIYVAGCIGPLGIDAPAAASLGIDRAECFTEQAGALLDGGVDFLFLETFTTSEEMEIAYRAIEGLRSQPVLCSFSCTQDGRLHCGTDVVDAFANLEAIGAKLFGVNCMNDPAATLQLVRHLPRKYRHAAYPTAGFPAQNGGSGYPIDPSEFARVTPE